MKEREFAGDDAPKIAIYRKMLPPDVRRKHALIGTFSHAPALSLVLVSGKKRERKKKRKKEEEKKKRREAKSGKE